MSLLVSLLVSSLVAGCGETSGTLPPSGAPVPAATAPASPARAAPSARYVGRDLCMCCHLSQKESFPGTHMSRSVVPLAKTTPAGVMEPPATVSHRGATFTMKKGPQGPEVTVANEGQAPRTFPVRHVLGHRFIQRLLIDLGRGQLASSPAYWDVRQRRWRHSQEGGVETDAQRLDETDALHWEGHLRSFGQACSRCHSSQSHYRLDEEKLTYQLSSTDPGVNCESCHGPGGRHVDENGSGLKGIKERARASVARILSLEPEPRAQICAQCHMMNFRITPYFEPGDRFFDCFWSDFALDRLYPDGSPQGYLYQYVPFAQSLCASRGNATCTSCHAPHGSPNRSLLTAAPPADGLCVACHKEVASRGQSHTHHRPGSPGAACVACHMRPLEITYMEHHDHRIAPPVPELTVRLGIPNACSACHKDKDAKWASSEATRLWGDYQEPRVKRAVAASAVLAGNAGAVSEVRAVVTDQAQPFMVRAVHTGFLSETRGPAALDAVLAALADPHPAVRMIAAVTLGEKLFRGLLPETQRQRVADELLARVGDPSRAVRRTALEAFVQDAHRALPDTPEVEHALGELDIELAANQGDPGVTFALAVIYTRAGMRDRAAKAIATVRAHVSASPNLGATLSERATKLGEHELADAIRAATATAQARQMEKDISPDSAGRR